MTNDEQREQLKVLLMQARTEERVLTLFGDIETQIDMPRGDEFTAYYLINHGCIVPTFNIGETVYLVLSGKVIKATIEEITYNKQGLYYKLQTEFGVKLRATSACLCLTREEEEEKIKK